MTGKEAKLEIPFAEEPETSWEQILEMLSEAESKLEPKRRGWEKAGKEAEFEIPFAEELEPWSLQILKGKSKQQPKERFTHYGSSRSVLQTVLMYQLEQVKMPGSNNLCCGIMKGILIYLVPFHCRD